MKARKLLIGIMGVVFVVYCLVAALLTPPAERINVLCYKNSYAEQWADKHHIEYKVIPDSEADLGILNVGDFDYSISGTTCAIEGYRGDDVTIAVPEAIKGYTVTEVKEYAFDDCAFLKEVYVPRTVERFEILHNDTITVYCYADSDTYTQLEQAKVSAEKAYEEIQAAVQAAETAVEDAKAALEEAKNAESPQDENEGETEDTKADAITQAENALSEAEVALEMAKRDAEAKILSAKDTEATEKGYLGILTRYEMLNDSYHVNFYSADIPFGYNKTDTGIELVEYYASQDIVCIPSTINGQNVTGISFDALNRGISTLVIPANITRIESKLSAPRFDGAFFCNICIVLAACITGILVTLKVYKENDDPQAKFLGISAYYTGFKYFVLLTIWAGVAAVLKIKWPIQIIVAVILIGLEVIEALRISTAKHAVLEIGQRTEERTEFMRSMTANANALYLGLDSAVLRAEAKRVYEALRYSDVCSDEKLKEYDDAVLAQYTRFENAVKTGNEADAKAAADQAIRAIKQRNAICKEIK